MSNRSKGNAFELRIKKYLESLGFVVDKARAALGFRGPGKVYSSPNDFLGCADLLAVHPKKPYTLFVQCTLGDIGPRMSKMILVPWSLDAQRVMVITRQDGIQSGIRALTLTGVYKLLDAEERGEWSEQFYRMKDGIELECLR